MKQQIGGVGKSAISVMRVLATGVTIVGSLAVPNLAQAVSPLLSKKTGLSRRDVEAGIRYSEKRGWVEYREAASGAEIRLTNTGRQRWQKIELDKPIASRRWDGRWRIVIFDIPSRRNPQRDALRNHLKRIGFRQLQESVWVIPHECAVIVATLKSIYKLTDEEVRLIQAKSFDGERMFAKQFNIGL